MKQRNLVKKYKSTASDIGKTLAVLLCSSGDGRQEHTKTVAKRSIINVYDNGAVLDSSNEVWFVRPYTKYGTDFVTVK